MPIASYRLASLLKTLLLLFSLVLLPVQAQTIEEEAANGDASAQFLLGITYLDGTLVTRNYKMAETWLLRAAEQGHPRAQYMLAALYTDGSQLKRDYEKAFHWGKILADKGDRMSQYGISVLYENGQGVEKNPGQARRWLQSAVTLGSPSAIARMDAQDSATQINALSDPKLSPEVFRKANELNDALSQYWIGHAYLTGRGLKKDTDQAWVWLNKASQQGNAFAQYDLSYLYPMGEGVRPEYQSAVALIQTAAASGHVKAIFNLAGMYEKGRGVMQNWNEAYRLYIIGAGIGNANAIARLKELENACVKPTHVQCETFQPETMALYTDTTSLYRIGLTLFDGDGITQSYGQSLRWFRLAANKGDVESQYRMAFIYQNGLGVERDKHMASYWYEIAARNGQPDAIRHVQTGR
ncbi:MAG: hypothetical protein GX776_09895 [Oxalobacter sp.]|nr:hypothetical protein [Oxalobacter sp.]